MNVFVADEQSEPVDVAAIRDLVATVLSAEGCPPQTEVSVILVGDEEMAGYNRRFLDRTGPTDVISLDRRAAAGPPPGGSNGGPPPMLGDVILSPAYIKRQAEELGESFEDELALMVVHGVLHLLGYEHDTDEDARTMEQREAEILRSEGRRRR